MDDNPIHRLIDSGISFTNFIWGEREDIEAGDAGPMLDSLNLLLTVDNADRYRQHIVIGVRGYDDDPREVFENPKIRAWIQAIDEKWPYWFFFCQAGSQTSLRWIAACLGKSEFVGSQISMNSEDLRLFLLRGFAAKNGLCEWLGDPPALQREMDRDIFATFGIEEELT